MNKIPLEILALSSSVTKFQSYTVVLGEVGGLRRIPIVIGSYEAQSIAVALEDIKPARPLTHDLLSNVLKSFSIVLEEAVIYKLVEGIFFAKLICNRNGEILEIDSRTSDAIALAIRNACPLFTYENILNEAASTTGEEHDESQEESDEEMHAERQDPPKEKITRSTDLSHYTDEELKQMMQKALENEDYDLAIQLRDELSTREAEED